MWLLQRKNIHKRHLLWLKLFSICAFFHGLFLVWLFLLYKDTAYAYLLSVDKKTDYSIPIIFKPYVTVPENKKNTPVIEEKKGIIFPEKAQNIVSLPAKTKQETQVKQEPQLPVKKEIEAASTTQESKKAESKSQPIEAKKPELNQSMPKEKIGQDSHKKGMENKPNPEKAYVHNNYKEVEILRCGAQLQKELVKQWHPPIGVSPDCSCEVSFVVSNKGTIEEMKIINPSGIMMFDISVKQALYAMKMPHWTYGKSLVVTFRQ